MGAQGSLSCYHFCRGVVIFLAMGRAICAKFLVAASVFAAARGDYNFEDMQCTVAIGECGGQLKCDNLDASKQCVLKQHAGCENNAVFQQAAHDIKDACEKETQCDAACEAEIKKAIEQKVEQKLKEMQCDAACKAEIKKAFLNNMGEMDKEMKEAKEEVKKYWPPTAPLASDSSLDIQCTVAIGECGGQLKCDNPDASKQCVLKQQAGCENNAVFQQAAHDIKDACEKETQCDAACEAEIKKAIEQKVEQKLKEMQCDAACKAEIKKAFEKNMEEMEKEMKEAKEEVKKYWPP